MFHCSFRPLVYACKVSGTPLNLIDLVGIRDLELRKILLVDFRQLLRAFPPQDLHDLILAEQVSLRLVLINNIADWLFLCKTKTILIKHHLVFMIFAKKDIVVNKACLEQARAPVEN